MDNPNPLLGDVYQLIEAKEKIIELQETVILELRERVIELENALKLTFISLN